MMHHKKPTKKLAVVTTIDGTMVALVLAQIKAAQKDGFEVYGLCAEGPYFQMLKDNGIIMHVLPFTRRPFTPFKDLAAAWKLYRFFRRERIDVVHTHTPKPALYGLIAAKLAGVKHCVNTAHGLAFNENMKFLPKLFFLTYEHIVARLANITLTQNPEDLETAKQLKIGNPKKVKVIGNGIDLEVFDPLKFDEKFIEGKKAEIGIPDDTLVVGTVGRLVEEKGFFELFEVMKNLMPKHKKLWLVIIGSEQPDKVGRISSDSFKEYGIADRTIWLGSRTDIPELLACFDIYAFPSWREGFPRSAIEAAAMKLPIVAANIRGSRQVVDDGINGILIPLRDVQKLEESLVKLIEDENLRNKMGQMGHIKAHKEFDENRVCKIVIDSYRELMLGK
jgi:glycosyltransferase involved in cell wall biosynthesis